MGLQQKIEHRQIQKLAMTQDLRQAIELLQFSNLEVTAFVENELQNNPFLELEEKTTEPPNEEAEPPLDTDFDNLWTGESYLPQKRSSLDDSYFEQNIEEKHNLKEHLEEQANLDIELPKQKFIANVLIDLVDDSGYFTSDINELAEQLSCSVDLIEEVLFKLQRLDPPGIFARNLQECLYLQLEDRNQLTPAIKVILNHLDLISGNDFTKLKEATALAADEIQHGLSIIRGLNPKPGDSFNILEPETMIPDLFMTPLAEGGWRVELNNTTLPKLLVNNHYYAEIKSKASDKEDINYIKNCYFSASMLVKALDQRATTLLKVASETINIQESFFIKGIEYFKPLVRRTIAEQLDLHESTVSRVTTNKYIATPRGIFELRYFFSKALKNTKHDGEDHAAEAIRHKIKAFIDQEPTHSPYSDETIEYLMKQDGVQIARRTIAKYRKQLGILNSSKRKNSASRL
jgi:RNA polymerase sigma-54 factor